MAPETGAQAEFLTVYFCTNGVGTLIKARPGLKLPTVRPALPLRREQPTPVAQEQFSDVTMRWLAGGRRRSTGRHAGNGFGCRYSSGTSGAAGGATASPSRCITSKPIAEDGDAFDDSKTWKHGAGAAI